MKTVFDDLKWLFFDAGSTLVDETLAYRLRFEDIAAAAGADFDTVLRIAMESYEKNGKGDHEAAKALGVPLTVWHSEAERLYPETEAVLSALHGRYRIGVIANQNRGTADRFRA